MLNLKQNLGVQSYCFRHFTSIPALIEQVKGVGLARTEVCGVHVNFDDERSFEEILGQFRAAGVAVSSIGVQRFGGDPAEEKWFAFAKAAGAAMISATFDVTRTPEAYRAADKLAEKYGMVLGIHNHGGYDWLGNSTMLQHVFDQTSERIGLCIDTAWCLQAGEEPVKWAERFNKRLYGAHLKDFTFDRAGKWSDVIVGTGNLRLKDFLAAALAAPRLATVTLEYEGDIENPGPALRQCVAAVRAATG